MNFIFLCALKQEFVVGLTSLSDIGYSMTFSISYKTYDKGAFNLIRFDGAEGSMIRQEDMGEIKN